MKKTLAISVVAVMLLTMLTGMTFTAGATEVTPTATITTQPTGQSWNILSDLTVGTSVVYTDNAMTYNDLGGLPLSGATYLQTTSAFAQESHDNSYNSATVAATISVNQSCDVYVLAPSDYSSYSGMKNSNYLRFLLPESEYAGNGALYGYDPVLDGNSTQLYITTSSNRKLYAYKKSISLTDGDTGSFNLGYPGRWLYPSNMYTVAIVWKENAVDLTPRVTLANTNDLGWVVTNGASITDSLQPWHNNATAYTVGLDAYDFSNVATIQTGRYEPANEPMKTLYKSNVTGTVETLTVNHSCDVYVLYPLEAISNCGKWLNDWGYTRCATNITSAANAPEFYVYKKEFATPDGVNIQIPLGTVNSNWYNQMCAFVVAWKTVNLVTLANTNNLGWVVTNNTSATDSITPWYSSPASYTTGLEAYDFSDIALIQTGRYEPASDPIKTLYKGNTTGMVETLTVNHSCELYVLYPLEARNECGKWLLNQGYTACETTLSGSPTLYVYKKSFPVTEGETLDIEVGAVNSNWSNQMCSFVVVWKDFPTLTLANTNELNWQVINNTSITGAATDLAYVNDTTEYYSTLNGYDFSDVSYIKSSQKYEPANEPYKTIYKGKPWQTVETMTINHSAEVYILNPWTTHNNYFQWIDNYGYQLQANQIVTSRSQSFNVYKRTYYLMDDETLDIPLGAANSSQVNKGYNVIVKWIDNPETVPNRATFTTIGANAANYVLTDNAHVGERPIVAHDRVITSLGNSGLEGSCILKPYGGDLTDPNFNYLEYNEAAESKDFYNVTINHSAEIYIATNGKQVSNYMEWLKGWTLVQDGSGNDITITCANTSGAETTYYLYKRAFKVNDGETRTIALKNAMLYANEMYFTFIKWLNSPTFYTVTLTADANTTVFPEAGSIDVLAGETLPVWAKANDGYYIDSFAYNGSSVYSDTEDAISYVTPAAAANATVAITTDALSNMPLPENLSYYPTAFSARGNQEPVVAGGKVYEMNIIGFATAKARIGEYERGEFGMLISLEEPASLNDMLITNTNLIKVPAEGANSLGQFGIRLYGDNIIAGQKVWMRAYANYDGTVIYGDGIIEATF